MEDKPKETKLEEGICKHCDETICGEYCIEGCVLCQYGFEKGEIIIHQDTVSVSEDGTEYDAEHYHKRCWDARKEIGEANNAMWGARGRLMDAQVEIKSLKKKFKEVKPNK